MRKGSKPAIVVAVALVLAMLLCLAGCGASQQSSSGQGTLRVGVRDDIMNFSYLNEQTGKYYGVEIDIAEEMAKRLGYADVEYITVTPDDRKERLMNGEMDCVIACYSISDSRLENFDFSPAYYHDVARIMVEDSSLITDPWQLQGKTIGIMAGSNTGPVLAIKLNEVGIIGENVISNDDAGTQYEGVYVKKVASYAELSQELEEGTVDAAAMDGAIASGFMNDDRSLLDFDIAEQEYGVATQKGSELSGRVAETIQGMIDDGTIAALTDKWN